ncbi:leucine-rich repeat-containing protein 43-like isoform X2 [Limulus polyphemus]|nr:leucine-rich repeat-containing protein 43-like isoform X2 [Limulus polyphemus]XP_022246973.1 leucine-rich repeat-containing protein 43-like isoform X2 [Limulus polyphemus]XP_022246974.1 leucine-rich repeat-containing protein 43-like isoform X2 [Limulus polyphemus]XP_022246975.1 leucine-rich repeat-containing protein 43-like isoform X2 [Limulus polyphemus]
MEVKAGSPLHSRRTFYQVFCHLVNKSNFLKYPCALELSNCDQAPFLGSYEAYEREALVRDPKSIWYIENEWSPDVKSLAEQAVVQKLSLKDIEQTFETLILRGKNITEVDRSVLKLKRLRCLILSVNNITEVFGSHLPKCLEILELYGNQIEDISKLCQNSPPGLLYVGLGQNRLHTLPSTNFPVLCTLDLTDNFLSNLIEVVAQLKSLGSLRSLAFVWKSHDPCLGLSRICNNTAYPVMVS